MATICMVAAFGCRRTNRAVVALVHAQGLARAVAVAILNLALVPALGPDLALDRRIAAVVPAPSRIDRSRAPAPSRPTLRSAAVVMVLVATIRRYQNRALALHPALHRLLDPITTMWMVMQRMAAAVEAAPDPARILVRAPARPTTNPALDLVAVRSRDLARALARQIAQMIAPIILVLMIEDIYCKKICSEEY